MAIPLPRRITPSPVARVRIIGVGLRDSQALQRRRPLKPWDACDSQNSSGFRRRLPGQAVVEVEHAFAPSMHAVVAGEQLERAGGTRPLETAENDIVGL